MKRVYRYLYFHLFSLVSSYRKETARESAILYLSTIVFFITLPFIGLLISYSIGSGFRPLRFVIVIGYAMLIHYFNKRYFERKQRIKLILGEFGNETKLQRRIGHVVAVLALIGSLLLFIMILYLM